MKTESYNIFLRSSELVFTCINTFNLESLVFMNLSINSANLIESIVSIANKFGRA